MSAEFYAVVAGVALVAWAVTAGADFGGGVWDLVARRPARPDVRRTIEHAIAPIWEANHVWLIFLVVLLFTVFPKAFAVIATALHIPITIALVGLVVRGAAFVMRAYGLETQSHRRGWGIAFGLSSVFTPIVLGMCLAALASGDIVVDDKGNVASGFVAGWSSAFAVAVGVFVLALFLLLSAVYLCYDADDDGVRSWFRTRALASQGVAFVLSVVVFFLARAEAPQLYASLLGAPWALPAQAVVFVLAVAVAVALLRRRWGAARLLVAAQAAVIVTGFGLAMDGHLVLPAVPVHAAGARHETMGPLLPVLVVGSLVLLPSLWFLFRLFKTRRAGSAPVE